MCQEASIDKLSGPFERAAVARVLNASAANPARQQCPAVTTRPRRCTLHSSDSCVSLPHACAQLSAATPARRASMDDLHSAGQHEHDYMTPPPNVTTAPTAHAHAHPHAHPAHPAHISDAVPATPPAATVPPSRPPTSYGEHEEEVVDDDDDSGGISLTDDQQLAESLAPDTHHSEAAVAVHHFAMTHLQQTAMTHPQQTLHQSSSHTIPSAPADAADFSAFFYYSSPFVPSPHELAYLSSSEQLLEPPPTLQEVHLSIQDRCSFAPITSFFHYLSSKKPTVPGLDLVQVPAIIDREDLMGDTHDFQGINWALRNTERSAVRAKRVEYEKEKLSPSLRKARGKISPTPNTDTFFSFRSNYTAHRAFFPHFQLRNVLASTSRNDIYYAVGHKVFRTDASAAPADPIIDLSKRMAPDGSITTIAAADNVLIAGAFEGEYCIADLASTYGSPCTFGQTSDFAVDTKSRIVNHLHLFESRTTYTPQAVFCSNDHRLQILDCATDTFTHSFLYPAAVNCAATSPNGRMRVVVGDFQETLITNAETGQAFETLSSHTDDAFACAWADDGIHVATAAQDSTIAVWDARLWKRPIAVIASELSIPRSLHFSPIGSGPRVLVAAEADDYVNIIDAQTFKSKQVFDFFGPLGGVSFTPDGQSLFVANGERRFGGIVEMDRTGWTQRAASRKTLDYRRDDSMTDWSYDDDLSSHPRVLCGDVERQRRNVDMRHLII
ncbi:WD40 repeat-like protein [Dothidotthia symphoricarpi CBS 119687]|uniref:WD40 repeat-like protein n=1 Tax=Dothidotthia symphoricarpi CBS 119687 TaxID=1392245 RepID=A0A6A6APB4_9PLEO|nr:WD40 repeat-like protein [Dothidotthia symphoricarpi CBS 119687]KAF2132727.1 WD40 repeat-like protein [Dothidotthia symphoricarpi CBS 119687]